MSYEKKRYFITAYWLTIHFFTTSLKYIIILQLFTMFIRWFYIIITYLCISFATNTNTCRINI